MTRTLFLLGRWPHRFAAAFALLTLCCSAYASDPDSVDAVLGRWVTESGNLEVEIAPCDEALCGTVVRVLANRSMQAPDSEMKPADARPALGMVILSDIRASGDNEWQGKIYNREKAKTYKCVIAPLSETQISVRGYMGLPLFGKTQVWRRVAETAGATR